MNKKYLGEVEQQVIGVNQELTKIQEELDKLEELYGEKEDELHDLDQLISKLEREKETKTTTVCDLIHDMITIHTANIGNFISQEAFNIYLKYSD